MNKRTIKLTYISPEYNGISNELFMDKTLFLRNARHVGDIETINNFVFGKLNEYKKYGIIDYEII